MTCSPLLTSDINAGSAIGQMMLSEDLGFEEAFWKWFDSLRVPYIIINGYAYGYQEPKEGQRATRFILIPAERKLVRAASVWRIGKTSKPNNARLISTEEYNFHHERKRLCQLKGCYDRYHCIWYDMEEERDGPWNQIPEDWKVGDEKCESFLSKET